MDDLKELLGKNPQVKEDQVVKAIEAVKALRASGLKTKGYDLARPFSIIGVRGRPMSRWTRSR